MNEKINAISDVCAAEIFNVVNKISFYENIKNVAEELSLKLEDYYYISIINFYYISMIFIIIYYYICFSIYQKLFTSLTPEMINLTRELYFYALNECARGNLII